MIRIKAYRDRKPMDTREVSIAEALKYMVDYEIGYGGQILAVTNDIVTTRTVVMGCIDDTVFEPVVAGEQGIKDFTLISNAAQLHWELRKRLSGLSEFTDAEVSEIMRTTKGDKFATIMGAGIIAGGGRAKAVYIALMDPSDEGEIKQLIKKTKADLYELVCLKHIEKIDEAMLKELIAI